MTEALTRNHEALLYPILTKFLPQRYDLPVRRS